MPQYQPFPPEDRENLRRLSAVLRQYLTDARRQADDEAAYTAFRLRDVDDGVDAFVLVARYDTGRHYELISVVSALACQFLRIVDGEPVVDEHFGEHAL